MDTCTKLISNRPVCAFLIERKDIVAYRLFVCLNEDEHEDESFHSLWIMPVLHRLDLFVILVSRTNQDKPKALVFVFY